MSLGFGLAASSGIHPESSQTPLLQSLATFSHLSKALTPSLV